MQVRGDDSEWFTAEEIVAVAHVHELDGVPRFKTYITRWIAERSARRSKTFGMQLKRLRRGVWPSPECRFHLELFKFNRPLYVALQQCARLDRDC
ncbi:hypothetical protein GCM10017635_23440 [Paracoccus kondratievae]|uniref:Uncharacterized protein n=1 Tax=Paracoccus kondratievae TaxID=135740 RepID=A0AAD3RTT5_9RHOB|nr:hypothetical protein GCM10017635_23440 [Paracoccus kondratievae]